MSYENALKVSELINSKKKMSEAISVILTGYAAAKHHTHVLMSSALRMAYWGDANPHYLNSIMRFMLENEKALKFTEAEFKSFKLWASNAGFRWSERKGIEKFLKNKDTYPSDEERSNSLKGAMARPWYAYMQPPTVKVPNLTVKALASALIKRDYANSRGFIEEGNPTFDELLVLIKDEMVAYKASDKFAEYQSDLTDEMATQANKKAANDKQEDETIIEGDFNAVPVLQLTG